MKIALVSMLVVVAAAVHNRAHAQSLRQESGQDVMANELATVVEFPDDLSLEDIPEFLVTIPSSSATTSTTAKTIKPSFASTTATPTKVDHPPDKPNSIVAHDNPEEFPDWVERLIKKGPMGSNPPTSIEPSPSIRSEPPKPGKRGKRGCKAKTKPPLPPAPTTPCPKETKATPEPTKATPEPPKETKEPPKETPEPTKPDPPAPEPKKDGDGGGGGSGWQAEMLKAVNAERSKDGLKPLCLNKKLTKAAEGHAADMEAKNFFDHTNLDGKTPFQRIDEAGFKDGTQGENIAKGQEDVTAVMDSWMHSEGHRANIMSKDYAMAGFGMTDKYWVQTFGGPNGEECD